EASLARKLGRRGGNAAARLRDGMAKAREIATQFPRLRARLDTAAAYGAAPEHSFEFGLRAILDGLAAHPVAPPPPAAPGPPPPPRPSTRAHAAPRGPAAATGPLREVARRRCQPRPAPARPATPEAPMWCTGG